MVPEMPLGEQPKLNNWKRRRGGIRMEEEEEAVTNREPQQLQQTNKNIRATTK